MRLTRLKNLLLAAVASLVLLEALLQAGAALVWCLWGGAGAATGPDAGQSIAAHARPQRTILCVGDSFTYGLGASAREHAYPAQLQRRLREQSGDPDWTVANRGWPGQDSREVLRRLDRQVRQLRPAIVYVMVGCNDHWTRPAALPPGGALPAADGFEWRWRTGRLLALLLARFDGPAAAGPDAGHPLTGVWRLGDLRFHFADDGALAVTWSFPPIAVARMDWRAQGKAIEIAAGGSLVMAGQWQRDGDRLVITAPGLPVPLVLEASEEARPGGVHDVLRGHLTQIVEVCRAAGATPVLATYPAPMFGVERVVADLARRLGVAWLDLRARFDQELRTRPHDELFVRDGHCSDAGYALVAEVAAADALSRAAGRPAVNK